MRSVQHGEAALGDRENEAQWPLVVLHASGLSLEVPDATRVRHGA